MINKTQKIAVRDEDKCVGCNFCTYYVCHSEECIGCGACSVACPYEAIRMVPKKVERRYVEIKVNGERFEVSERITVKDALEMIGYKIDSPCKTGGCWSCAVEANGKPVPSCVTPIQDGMSINTELENPVRLVHGFSGHTVGGVGTPWHLKNTSGYIEVACFAAGCNFRCLQCQNWPTTYMGKGIPVTPRTAAEVMTVARRSARVDRMAISGGECTLNRWWLLHYIKELKSLNDDSCRIHVDTNGSTLTKEYIDELVDTGMTDIGIDLKALDTNTFMRITGLNKVKSEEYKERAWGAVKYIVDNHDTIFLGVGLPYNRDLIPIDEIKRMGEKIFRMDSGIQVSVLDHRGEFRRRNLFRPSYEEMYYIYEVLKDVGLRYVICQTSKGHIGP